MGAVGFLAWRAWRRGGNRAAVIELVYLSLGPTVFASNLILVTPMVSATREILILVVAGLLGYAVGLALPGFGGGYLIIPFAVLFLLGAKQIQDPAAG